MGPYTIIAYRWGDLTPIEEGVKRVIRGLSPRASAAIYRQEQEENEKFNLGEDVTSTLKDNSENYGCYIYD